MLLIFPSKSVRKNTPAPRTAARAMPTASRGIISTDLVVLDLISTRWLQIHQACQSCSNINITRHCWCHHQQPTQNTHRGTMTSGQMPSEGGMGVGYTSLFTPHFLWPSLGSIIWQTKFPKPTERTFMPQLHLMQSLITVLLNWENPSKMWRHHRNK